MIIKLKSNVDCSNGKIYPFTVDWPLRHTMQYNVLQPFNSYTERFTPTSFSNYIQHRYIQVIFTYLISYYNALVRFTTKFLMPHILCGLTNHQGPVFIDGMVNSTEAEVHSKTNSMKDAVRQLLLQYRHAT